MAEDNEMGDDVVLLAEEKQTNRFLKGIYYHWRMPKAPFGRISAFQLVTEDLLKQNERSAQTCSVNCVTWIYLIQETLPI